MAVLKYRDPVSGEYVPLSWVGPGGDPGPSGPAGPAGDTGSSEVVVGSAAPTNGESVWVSTVGVAGSLRYNDGGTYKVPAQLRGHRLVSVGTPTVATDAATVGYARQGLVTADTTWKIPTFENGWKNYSDIHANQPYARAAYRRLGNGMVAVQGLIAGGTMGSPAFYLEPGYRPPYRMSISSFGGGGVVRVAFNPEGDVIPQQFGSSGNNGYVAVNWIFQPA